MGSMEYKIIGSQYPLEFGGADLEHEVQKYIKEGWKPQGGLAVVMGYCYQAMIKEDDE